MKSKSAEEILTEVAKRNGYGSWDMFTLGETREVIKRETIIAITFYTEQFKPKWVPVTERLPETNTRVLVLSTSDSEVLVSEVDEKGKWWRTYTQLPGVTHWMPLPQLPNENKEE